MLKNKRDFLNGLKFYAARFLAKRLGDRSLLNCASFVYLFIFLSMCVAHSVGVAGGVHMCGSLCNVVVF